VYGVDLKTVIAYAGRFVQIWRIVNKADGLYPRSKIHGIHVFVRPKNLRPLGFKRRSSGLNSYTSKPFSTL